MTTAVLVRTRRSQFVEAALFVVCAGLVAGALGLASLSEGRQFWPAGHGWILSAYLVTILLGHLVPLELPGGRVTVPVSTAASLALAMTITADADAGAEPILASTVILITTAGTALGLAVRRFRGGRVQVVGAQIRIVAVALAAILFRAVPVGDGTLATLAPGWRPWQAAVAMLLVSTVAVAVEGFLFALVRRARTSTSMRVTLTDEARQAAGLSTALSSTGTLIAIAEPSMKAWALPLFLLPLLMTQFAVRRQAAIRRTYGQTILALSRLTELGGYTPVGHPERVAALAMSVGTELGLSVTDMRDLEYAALLHDIGQVSLKVPIPGGATVLAAPADQKRIASDGADIVRHAGALDTVAHIIDSQPTPYRQVREFGEDLPMASRIIKVVNAYDDLVGGHLDRVHRERAIERIQLGLGYEYDPSVVDALSRVLARQPDAALVRYTDPPA